MENHCCSSYYLAYAVYKRAAGRLRLSKCAVFLLLVSYWEVVTRILIFCGLFLVGMIFSLMRIESIFFNLFWNVNFSVAAKKNFCPSWIWMIKSDFLLSVIKCESFLQCSATLIKENCTVTKLLFKQWFLLKLKLVILETMWLLACEQALLFGRVKKVSRERARLASLAQIGEHARRLCTWLFALERVIPPVIPVGLFRVPPGLCIKTRLGAQPFLWK